MPAISNQRPFYIVFGAGISGRAATRWLLQHDKDVLLYDEDAQQLSAAAVQKLTHPRLQVTAQQVHVQQALLRCAELIVSPGIDRTHPLLTVAKAQGIGICSEVELSLRHYRGKIAVVTGTNGKSTVCAMLHHILQQLQLPSALGGNIGTALTEVLLPEKTAPELLVVELSSFQLEHTQLPALAVAIFTNFSPSHLTRHGDAATYFALKQKLFAALAADGLAICDTSVHAKLTTQPANLCVVGEKNAGENFFYIDGRRVFLADKLSCDCRSLPIHTPHDMGNALMALLAAQQLTGLELSQLVPHLHSWQGLPYRLQLVGYLDGQAVINDSKATDVAATLAALRAQTEPVLLMLGGEGEEAQQLLTQRDKIAGVLAFGAKRKELHAQLHKHFAVQQHTDLAAVLAQLQQTCLSVPLLFSPACVSKPEFANFVVRGKFFNATLGKMKNFEPTIHSPKAV